MTMLWKRKSIFPSEIHLNFQESNLTAVGPAEQLR